MLIALLLGRLFLGYGRVPRGIPLDRTSGGKLTVRIWAVQSMARPTMGDSVTVPKVSADRISCETAECGYDPRKHGVVHKEVLTQPSRASRTEKP